MTKKFNEIISNIERVLNQDENQSNLNKATELHAIKNRFETAIDGILDDAKRRHQNISMGAMPWWGWALLIYTGHDDILRLVGSWYGIIIFTLIFATYIVLQQMGLGYIPKTALYIIQDRILKIFKK